MVNQGIVLGHVISNRGIEVDKAKIELISKFPSLTRKLLSPFISCRLCRLLQEIHQGFFEDC